MGTEVLRAQGHFNISTPRTFSRRSHVSSNITLLVDDKISPDRNKKAKKSPLPKKTRKRVSDLGKDEVIKVRNLVHGHVTLLKRDDNLDSVVAKSKAKPNPTDTIVLKQIRLPDPARNLYAGSVISTLSPSPRALPQPTFFIRKRENEQVLLDDFATNDLRRLLRLE